MNDDDDDDLICNLCNGESEEGEYDKDDQYYCRDCIDEANRTVNRTV